MSDSGSASHEERYRLYVDESGDHVFRKLDELHHRFLCLLGCWFADKDYVRFHQELEVFKQGHLPHSPDEPLILHREDLVNQRGTFWRLRDPSVREAFDRDLLELIARSQFKTVAVVIDKKELQAKYPTPAHPYHLAMGFLLQRYCGYLNHINRSGDVLAESRGKNENVLLMDSYSRHYTRGAWHMKAEAFQRALTSSKLKVKPKTANIAGLQMADLLANPLRRFILLEQGLLGEPLGPFAERLLEVAEPKLNRQLYTGRVDGYGTVFFPREE
jgi:hypothetical protein